MWHNTGIPATFASISFQFVNARMRNERIIVMWGKCHLIAGRKISNVAYTHDSLQVLSSFNCKNSRFLEVEIKRNRLNFCIVFVRLYFGENGALFSGMPLKQLEIVV